MQSRNYVDLTRLKDKLKGLVNMLHVCNSPTPMKKFTHLQCRLQYRSAKILSAGSEKRMMGIQLIHIYGDGEVGAHLKFRTDVVSHFYRFRIAIVCETEFQIPMVRISRV